MNYYVNNFILILCMSTQGLNCLIQMTNVGQRFCVEEIQVKLTLRIRNC